VDIVVASIQSDVGVVGSGGNAKVVLRVDGALFEAVKKWHVSNGKVLHSHGLYGDKDDAAAVEFTVPLGGFGNLGGRSLQQQLVFVGPSI
jgi:hypothetical protein